MTVQIKGSCRQHQVFNENFSEGEASLEHNEMREMLCFIRVTALCQFRKSENCAVYKL